VYQGLPSGCLISATDSLDLEGVERGNSRRQSLLVRPEALSYIKETLLLSWIKPDAPSWPSELLQRLRWRQNWGEVLKVGLAGVVGSGYRGMSEGRSVRELRRRFAVGEKGLRKIVAGLHMLDVEELLEERCRVAGVEVGHQVDRKACVPLI
jgi:hypothetical protein